MALQNRGMHRWFVVATLVLGGALQSVRALNVNPNGLGQVMVYPYYTANSNNSTLLWVSNTTANGKAVRLRFHEGYDGRGVLDFNMYLGPHATWSGVVVNRLGSADAPASLVTHETTCTVPAFAPLSGVSGTWFLDFSGASFAGTNEFTGPTGNSDGGPTGLDRTREGHFDIIEMGEVTNASHASLTAITPVDGIPPHCAQVQAAWNAGGYWNNDSKSDLSTPGGGLYGGAAVIDVAQGVIFPFNAVAIDGFSTEIQHTAPGAITPDLHTASASADRGAVAAFVMIGGRLHELDYTNPIDAISALFMTSSLYNEFDKSANLGAHSDWIVTAPTKRYYVDPAYVGLSLDPGGSGVSSYFAKAPFQTGFLQTYVAGQLTTTGGVVLDQWGNSFPYACDVTSAIAYGRDGFAFAVGHPGHEFPGSFDSSESLQPCLETSVLTFSADASAGGGGTPISALGSNLTNATDPGNHFGIVALDVETLPFSEGHLTLDLLHDGNGTSIQRHQLSPASNGDVLQGLPVIGLLVENYVNYNVTPGVLANYSAAYAHRAAVSCTTNSGPCQ